jgi:hypothetical protein
MGWFSSAFHSVTSTVSKAASGVVHTAENVVNKGVQAVMVPVHGVESAAKLGVSVATTVAKDVGKAATFVAAEAKAGVQAVETVAQHVVHDAAALEAAGLNIASGVGGAVKGLGDIVPYLAIGAAVLAGFYLMNNPQMLGGKAKRA